MKVSGLIVVGCLAACQASSTTTAPPGTDDPGTGDPGTDPGTPGSDPGNDDPFLVDITNSWQVLGENNDHSFTLNASPPGKVSSATISGTEFLAGGAGRRTLDGMFKNRVIHFTSTLDTSTLDAGVDVDVVTYDGRFSDETHMDLTVSETGANLTLFCFCGP